MSKKAVFVLGAIGGLIYPLAAFGVEKQPVSRPNVIFIYADDMGKGMLSAYGQKQFKTPHIDALANEGVSFSNAYGCMLSAPARASLLTGYHDCRTDKWKITNGGQYLERANIEKAGKQIDAKDLRLPKGDYYLPQVFKQAGYTTAEIGKLEWGFTATHQQMKDHGWDYYYGYLDHIRCHGFYPPFLFENGEVVTIEGNTRKDCGKNVENMHLAPEVYHAKRWDMTGKKQYSQDLFLGKILDFIRANKDKPFFLFHPTQLPHGPVSVPRVHPDVVDNPNLTELEKEYASMVKMLDDHVGIIMAELRTLGIEENTIVVFSSDNGHEIYYAQAGRCEKPYKNLKTGKLFDDYTDKYYSDVAGDVFNGNAGMAGLKRSNLEGGVHLPLVFYWKGHLEKGKARAEVVSNYDFLPTMADLLKVTLPVKKDGVSILPVLMDNKKLDKERYVVFGSNTGPGLVMNDGWKLRYYRKNKAFELYNLREDPQERKDLTKENPKKAEELKAILLKECGENLENGVNRWG